MLIKMGDNKIDEEDLVAYKKSLLLTYLWD